MPPDFHTLRPQADQPAGAELSVWWSERTCRQVTGELVRPDGHGVWTEAGRTCSFWLEFDRGTEQAHRVASKLDGYADLHRATGLNHLVLVWAPTPARETSLRARLAQHSAVVSGTLTVATAGGGTTAHPAGPVWAPVADGGRRVPLAHLADAS